MRYAENAKHRWPNPASRSDESELSHKKAVPAPESRTVWRNPLLPLRLATFVVLFVLSGPAQAQDEEPDKEVEPRVDALFRMNDSQIEQWVFGKDLVIARKSLRTRLEQEIDPPTTSTTSTRARRRSWRLPVTAT